jgi:hypothetical protein
MISKMMLSIVLFFSVASVQAQLLTATEILNQIHTEYSQRFDSNGRIIDDPNLTDKFKVSQLNAIETLK